MSKSSFSKAHEEIANLEPMEMTFTIEDADLDKLNDVLKDINVRECPWFEVQDKHGNKARYYREQHWIPCSEGLPEINKTVLFCDFDGDIYVGYRNKWRWWNFMDDVKDVVAWMPLPSPYQPESEG